MYIEIDIKNVIATVLAVNKFYVLCTTWLDHCGYKDEKERYDSCSHQPYKYWYLEWVWIVERLSHNVVKGHDGRISELWGTPGKHKTPHVEAWVSFMCVGCGRGKWPSYKTIIKDIDAWKTLRNIMWLWHGRKDIQKSKWSHWLGPCYSGLVDFIIITMGFYGQILVLEITKLYFQYRKATVATVWRMVWERGKHCLYQNSLETSAVILEDIMAAWMWIVAWRGRGVDFTDI